MGHAFISYVREDSRYVDQLQQALETAGVPVWRDTADLWPGEDWRAKIRQAITGSALAFIACFSTRSLAREVSYQNEELALAIDQFRLYRPDCPWLIPVRFDDCSIPVFEIGSGRTLASIQHVDLFGDRAHEGVARLVAAILRILGPYSETVPNLASSASGSPALSRPMIKLPDPFSEDEIVTSDPAVYLMKVINPPGSQDRQKSTVWLAAKGDVTYIFDSITIWHRMGMSCSMGSGAIPPDANYSFSFEYGSQRTHALNPAIVLSHEDRREVSFTIGLAPKGAFPTTGGQVHVTLHYHATDGIQGTLEVREPSKVGLLLARALDSDVEFGGMVTTSTGILRGKDDRAYQGSLVYEPIRVPQFCLPDDEELTSIPDIILTPERLALNKRVANRNLLVWLTKLLQSGESFAFDLCSGLPGLEYEEALVEAGRPDALRALAIAALAVRHMLNPNDTLASFIIDRYKEPSSRKAYKSAIDRCGDDVVTALVCRPKGKWARALLALADLRNDHALSAFYLMRDRLTDAERRAGDKIAWRELTVRYPKESAIRYLRWRGYSDTKIESALMKRGGSDSAHRADLRDKFFASSEV